MKNKIFSSLLIVGLIFATSCKDSLDYTPAGVLSSADLTSPTAIDGLVTAAYAYIAKEKVRRTYLSTAKFTAGRDEYLPIPQAEITFTNGLYKQNPGF